MEAGAAPVASMGFIDRKVSTYYIGLWLRIIIQDSVLKFIAVYAIMIFGVSQATSYVGSDYLKEFIDTVVVLE